MRAIPRALLGPYTSLRVGGEAERLVITEKLKETLEVIKNSDEPVRLLGYGCNCLISDDGLKGTTIIWRGGNIVVEGTRIVADAGVWWDKVVMAAIENGLWGLELMSEIPSSIGGAVFGNIAAYGQQISDTLEWIEIYDSETKSVKTINREDIDMSYRSSALQSMPNIYILRAAFKLSQTPTHVLRYDSAIAIGNELGLKPDNLEQVREIIIETRRRAGSIYHPDDKITERTAGSFFKNPLVTIKEAEMLAKFDETGKTVERVLSQSKIHGGSTSRASAAHVLFAAGFHRGQKWDKVQLHPSHVLKVATLPGATAQEVYDVSNEIITTVRQKLGIELEPEVKFLGKF